MIRYIYVGDQIDEGAKDFAFFDTITDSFISFDGEQVFSSMKDFTDYAIEDERYIRCMELIPWEV
jgi:hypothetical protein